VVRPGKAKDDLLGQDGEIAVNGAVAALDWRRRTRGRHAGPRRRGGPGWATVLLVAMVVGYTAALAVLGLLLLRDVS